MCMYPMCTLCIRYVHPTVTDKGRRTGSVDMADDGRKSMADADGMADSQTGGLAELAHLRGAVGIDLLIY